jgi:hypothetical protein
MHIQRTLRRVTSTASFTKACAQGLVLRRQMEPLAEKNFILHLFFPIKVTKNTLDQLSFGRPCCICRTLPRYGDSLYALPNQF